MTLNRTFARLPFAAAAALVTVTSFALTAPVNAATATLAPVAATEEAIAASGGPAPVAQDADKRICVTARLTGSRMNTKICKTKSQWEAAGGLPTK